MNLLLSTNISSTIATVLLIVIGAFLIISLFIKGSVRYAYNRSRYRKSDLGVGVEELGRTVLDKYGLVDVEVKKGVFPTYKRKKKVVYCSFLRGKSSSLICYTWMMQACALAIMDARQDKKYPKYALNSFITVLSAISFVVFLVGFIVSLVIKTVSTFALVVGIITIVLFLLNMILSILQLRNEKAVRNEVIKMMEELNIFAEEDEARMLKLLKLYAVEMLMNTLLSTGYALYAIVKFFKLLAKFKRNK